MRIGPFELIERIGRGGTATVWRGTHDSGLEVAVKVLRGDAGGPEGSAELAAAARLDHPHVVRVYDHGRVGPEEAAPAEAITAGARWLALQRVAGRDLSGRCGALPWDDCRAVLEQVLAALAHAHARGVVHRDVKPRNILVEQAMGGLHARLADFGLAVLVRTADALGCPSGGTAAYMAPEQFSGSWRDVGPWTDLYGLGCVAWALVTGAAPFERPSLAAYRTAHELAPLPERIPARCSLPAGFEAWVRALLAKRPEARPQHAADALHALGALGAPGHQTAFARFVPVCAGDPSVTRFAIGSGDEGVEPVRVEVVPTIGPCPMGALPQEGRRPGRPGPARSGARMFGWRTPRLVGRHDERRALWEALRRVREGRGPGVVALTGLPGMGRTRLAEWFATAAHETGAAHTLHVRSGLVAALENLTRSVELVPSRRRARVRSELARRGVWDPALLDDACHLLAARLDHDTAARARMGRPSVRRALWAQLLTALGRRRPLVLLVDDDDAVDEVGALLGHLLAAPEPVRVLSVLCGDATVLERLPRALEALHLPLGPLPPDAWHALVSQLVWLAPADAARLEALTSGNPNFAIGCVRQWLDEGLLDARGPELVVAERAWQRVPGAVGGVWERRLARCPDEPRRALEVAAALGTQVDGPTWAAVCACSGRPWTEATADALRRQGFVERQPHRRHGWRFVDPAARAVVAAHAGEAWRSVNRCCADVLAGTEGAHGRVGSHLIEAEAWSEALPFLLRAAAGQLDAGELHRAAWSLERAEGALQQTGDGGAPAIESALLRGRLARARGDLPVAIERAQWALEAARAGGHDLLQARAACERGELARMSGHFDAAVEALERCVALASARGEVALAAKGLQRLCIARFERGQTAEAVAAGCRAVAIFDELGDAVSAAIAVLGTAIAYQRAGRHELATAAGLDALSRHTHAGCRWGTADAAVHLGECARLGGRHDEAWAHYQLAIDRYTRCGYPTAPVEFNLGEVELATGALEAADRRFERLEAGFRASERWSWVLRCVLGRALAAGRRGRRSEAAARLREARALLPRGRFVDPEVAGRLAAVAGQLDGAAEAEARALSRALAAPT